MSRKGGILIMYAQKSDLRNIAEITILVGAIVETIGHAFLILGTFGLWAIIGGPIIALLWIARAKAMKGSRGWAIYGIVHGALTGWITLVGYILLVVDQNRTLN